MRLFVCILGSQKGIFRTSLLVSTITGIAIEFFGVPPVTLLVVAYGGVALTMATQTWARRHPDEH